MTKPYNPDCYSKEGKRVGRDFSHISIKVKNTALMVIPKRIPFAHCFCIRMDALFYIAASRYYKSNS
jgi:hypothetical protein